MDVEMEAPSAADLARLDAMPIDLLVRIQSHLGSQDLFSLRRVCRYLHGVSLHRYIWTDALRKVCDEQHAFPASFPTNDMSLSQLEHAATAHSRFASRLRDQLDPEEPLQYTALRILNPHPDLDDPVRPFFQDVFLVPGGRYLVVHAIRTGSTIPSMELWDLGYSSSAELPRVPLASIDILDYLFTPLLVSPSPDDTCIRLVVTTVVGGGFRFILYEVNPTDFTPQFQQRATFEFMPNEVLIMGDVPKPQVVLDRECLAVYDAAGSIIIWNFVQNSWSEVCTDIYDAIGFRMFNENVILMSTTETIVYHIPPLTPCVPGCVRASQLPPQSPPMMIIAPPPALTFVSSPPSWPHSHPEHYEVVQHDQGSHAQIFHLKLQTVESATPRLLPVPLEVGSNIDIVLHHHSSHLDLRNQFLYDGTRLVTSTMDRGGLTELYLHLVRFDPTDPLTTSDVVAHGILIRWDEVGAMGDTEWPYSMCHVSGRVAVPVHDDAYGTSEWTSEIRIYDFVQTG